MASHQKCTATGRHDLEPFWPSRQHHDFDRVCCRATNAPPSKAVHPGLRPARTTYVLDGPDHELAVVDPPDELLARKS
ncbi:hypothetical protein ACFQ51_12460 [Streptomyces kaempferi]